MTLCSGHSKQTGLPCKQPVSPGRTVCYYHGGRTPRGIAHPSTTTGRYSKHLPTRMMERYQEAQNDADLLALNAELHLLDALLADALKQVATGESARRWRALKTALLALTDAQRRGDAGAEETHLAAIGALVDAGDADSGARAEVVTLVEARRRLVESEQKRLVAMGQMIGVDRAMTLVGALIDVVRRHVTDRAVLAAVSNDLERVLAVDNARGS